jgi:hypothetical protein
MSEFYQALTQKEFLGNFILLCLNLLVSFGTWIYNTRVVVRRRREEREYQSKLFLYQTLVIANVTRFIEAAENVQEEGSVLMNNCLKRHQQKQKVRPDVEASCEELDKMDRDFNASVIASCLAYSRQLHSQLGAVWAKYYDIATDLFSKLDVATYRQDLHLKVSSDLAKAKATFIRKMIAHVEDAHPAP